MITATGTRPLRFAAGAALFAVALACAGLQAAGARPMITLAPLALVAAIALIAIGCYRFEWFVLCVLVLRTVLDLTKAGAGGNALVSPVRASPDAVASGTAASALAILFIIMSVLWLAAQRRAGTRASLSAADGAFALFVTACLLSVVTSVARTASLTQSARIIAAVMMFVVLERLLRDLAQVRRVLLACFLSALAPVLLALAQAVSGRGRFVTDGVSRVVGTFLHPNTLGFFLAMFLLFAIALYRHCTLRTRRMLLLVIALCGIVLVLSYSRGAWLAFLLGLIVIGILQSRVIFAWLLGGAILVAAALPTVVGRITSLESSGINSSGNSLVWRLNYWTDVAALNHHNPVTGIGLNGTKFVTEASKSPHNDFLRAYAETGVLGLLGFVLVIIAFLAIARRALRTAPAGFSRGVAVGFAGVLTAYIVDSLGANLLSEVVVLWYFYAFAACAVAVARLRAEPLEPAEQIQLGVAA